VAPSTREQHPDVSPSQAKAKTMRNFCRDRSNQESGCCHDVIKEIEQDANAEPPNEEFVWYSFLVTTVRGDDRTKRVKIDEMIKDAV
jgi:transcriptional regulatory protein LevR